MTSRERIRTIFSGQPADRCGFWLGSPHSMTWPIYFEHFGAGSCEDVRRDLRDEIRHISGGSSKAPDGTRMFPFATVSETDPTPYFANCEDPAAVDDYPWRDAAELDFTPVIDALKDAGPYYRASGTWSPFFHIVADFFGMENYFVKMYTHPDVVEAVTQKVCETYLQGNEKLFELAGDEIDGVFFGNDFGTQRGLFVSPQLLDRFVMPYMREFVSQGHRHGYQVMFHCCGSVYDLIPQLIDMGVDALNPLQALAHNMDAETLARDFKGKIAFLGGIDTQQLLIHATPEQVKEEVRRVKRLLGPNLVVSPSHETLLPNVPPANVEAMAEAAREED